MELQSKIPVYVLSGFLGSGKTTVLLQMLEHCQQMNWTPGIILNELGETNVENHLFKNQNVIELLNGCICCTIQDDLKETMDGLMQEMENQPLDVLFIEGTGVANPMEIQEVLLSTPYSENFSIASIITVLDASLYSEYQSVFNSSAEVRRLMKEQMVCGSMLLLNKTDLVKPGHLDKIKQKVLKIVGEDKTIVDITFGKADAELLFSTRIQSVILSPKQQQPDQEHHHHLHHSTFKAYQIDLDGLPPISKKAFERWLRMLPDNVLRGKGYIWAEENRLYSFQYASRKVEFLPIQNFSEKRPLIILIGTGLEEQKLQALVKRLIIN